MTDGIGDRTGKKGKTYRSEIIKRIRTKRDKLIKPSLIPNSSLGIHDRSRLISGMRSSDITRNLEIIRSLRVRILSLPLDHRRILESRIDNRGSAVDLSNGH